MKRLLLILLVFGLLRVETPADEPAVNNPAQAGHPQTICPVMGGAINTNLFIDAAGFRIYVCCPACLKAVKADQEKYIKKMEQDGVQPERIPSTEEKQEKISGASAAP